MLNTLIKENTDGFILTTVYYRRRAAPGGCADDKYEAPGGHGTEAPGGRGSGAPGGHNNQDIGGCEPGAPGRRRTRAPIGHGLWIPIGRETRAPGRREPGAPGRHGTGAPSRPVRQDRPLAPIPLKSFGRIRLFIQSCRNSSAKWIGQRTPGGRKTKSPDGHNNQDTGRARNRGTGQACSSRSPARCATREEAVKSEVACSHHDKQCFCFTISRKRSISAFSLFFHSLLS